ILQLQTANDNADQALALSMGIVRDFIENGPTEAQLEAAKANILGSRALETADNSDIIGQLGAIGFYDLPLDYLQRFNQRVEAVTVEEIRAAFQRALDADRLAIVSIGPRAPQTDRQ
ncbi:MAG TPA: peptidase M16, partial [Alcanivorax sp.]|nr:peptidase M16 [Alcanivorax sp.]